MEYSIFGLLLSFISRFIYTKMPSFIIRKEKKKQQEENYGTDKSDKNGWRKENEVP